MKEVLSRRGIVGVVALLAGGGGRAVAEQAVEAVRERVFEGSDMPMGMGHPSAGGSTQNLNPVQVAAQLVAAKASAKARRRTVNIGRLRSMSPAAREHYARKAHREAMEAHHKFCVLMGFRSATDPVEEW